MWLVLINCQNATSDKVRNRLLRKARSRYRRRIWRQKHSRCFVCCVFRYSEVGKMLLLWRCYKSGQNKNNPLDKKICFQFPFGDSTRLKQWIVNLNLDSSAIIVQDEKKADDKMSTSRLLFISMTRFKLNVLSSRTNFSLSPRTPPS